MRIPEDDFSLIPQSPIQAADSIKEQFENLPPHIEKIYKYLTEEKKIVFKKYLDYANPVFNTDVLRELNNLAHPQLFMDNGSNENLDDVKDCSHEPPSSLESENVFLSDLEYNPGVSEAELTKDRKNYRVSPLRLYVDRDAAYNPYTSLLVPASQRDSQM